MGHALTDGASGGHLFEAAGIDLIFKPLQLDDPVPTGRQILAAVGLTPYDQHVVLQWLSSGDIEEIRLEETVKPEAGQPARFVTARADRTYRFILDDHSMEWPVSGINETALRKLSRIGEDKVLLVRLEDRPDRQLDRDSVVDLNSAGTEEIYSRAMTWELNVQGVIITSERPEISVREALARAGFDVNAAWVIVLKTASERRQVGLDFVIDLRLPGIEKLRLTPKEINNGEATTSLPRAFTLLPADERGLADRRLIWSTIIDQGRRWLVLHDVALPEGFNVPVARIAMEIPPSYPAGEIDMFYVLPHLARTDGRIIPQTQVDQPINGNTFQRWSRHRGALAPWRPGVDNVLTHLTLIDASLSREVES